MRQALNLIIVIAICSLQCSKNAASPASAYASPSTSGQGGSLARFTIVGNYLYTVDDQKLNVFDLTNGASPELRNTVAVGFEIETIFPFKDRLFIGSTSVVHIFSISDPLNPKKLSEAISPQMLRRCDPVVAKDTVAFATLRSSGPCGGIQSILAVYDIKDITRPVQKAFYPVNEPYGLGYWNDVLYVCDRSGLLVFDISQPYKPLLLKTITGGSYVDVIPYSDMLICWVRDGIVLYDITNNQEPVLLAKII